MFITNYSNNCLHVMSIDYTLCPLDLEQIKYRQAEIIRRFIINISEEKILIFDKNATSILNNIIQPSDFKDWNVKETYYTNSFTKYEGKYYIYFVFPTLESISFMNYNRKFMTDGKNKHIVCFMRKRDIKIENNLHYNYIWNFVTIEELDIGMIPVEYDCINMCMSNSIERLFLDKDIRTIKHIVECLEIIQRIYGGITEIVAYGGVSIQIKEMIELENKINNYGNTSCINKLILFDRTIDTITPCLSQLTYEGIIDDKIGIINGIVKINNQMVPLNSNWEYYKDVRDQHMNMSKQLLKTHITCCKIDIKTYSENPDIETLRFITDIVKRNKVIIEYLQKHVEIINSLSSIVSSNFFQKTVDIENTILTVQEKENIFTKFLDDTFDDANFEFLDYIDKSVNDKEELHSILGCLTLYFQIHGNKLTNDGYNNLISTLVDKYNCYEIINHMEKLGLMNKKNIDLNNNITNLISFNRIIHKLELLKHVDVNKMDQNNMHCLYGGYAPISGKIIEKEKSKDGFTLVCFVGGCNYSEISACRLTGDIVVLTTDIFNKKQFFYSL